MSQASLQPHLLLWFHQGEFYLENIEIFCPQGSAVANVSDHIEQQFSCENQCPTDAYTFQAGSAVINGNKHYQNSPYNITYNRFRSSLQICPLGANCTGPIKLSKLLGIQV